MTAPFRLRPPEPSEFEIHALIASVLDALLMPPAMWCCYPAGAIQLTPAQHARYSRLGLKRGMPDILVFYEGVWGLEVKRSDGWLSKTRVVRTRSGAPRVLVGQEEVFPALIRTKAFKAIAIVHSADETLRQLDLWGIPLRGRVQAA